MATLPLTFKQRLLQTIPRMIQGGLDAAATPGTVGGMADVFRAIQNSQGQAMQRDIARLQQERQLQQMVLDKQQQDLAERQYKRLVESNTEAGRHNLELESEATTKRSADDKRADENLKATFANAGLNPDGTPLTSLTTAQRLKATDDMGAREHPTTMGTPLIGGTIRPPAGIDHSPAAKMALPMSIGAGIRDIPLAQRIEVRDNPIPRGFEPLTGTSGDQQMIVPDFQTRSNMKLPTTFQGAGVRTAMLAPDGDASDANVARLARVQAALRNPTTWAAEMIAATRDGDAALVDELAAKSKAAGVGPSSGRSTEAERFVMNQYEPYKTEPTQQNWEKGLKVWATARQQPQRPPQTGMIVNGEYQVLRPGMDVGAGAVTPAGMSSLNVPTSTTRTMTETAPAVLSFIDKLIPMVEQGARELGPAIGRWNDLMTSEVGLANPTFARLRTNLGLLETAIMRMHVGASGSDRMLQHFHDLIGQAKQDPENMKAVLDEIKMYAHVIQSEGQLKNQGAAPRTPAAPSNLNDMSDEQLNQLLQRLKGGK